MADTDRPAPAQRAWRAACPQCGAPVEFRSAASAFAVCSYCRSQVLRDGDALRRVGQSAELFDDHSALRLGASGRLDGLAFTLLGRRQLRTADGVWSEWHAVFDGAEERASRAGWLSEDNGRYVFSFEAPLAEPAPAPEQLQPGLGLRLGGQAWTVASRVVATLAAAEGELPSMPRPSGGFVVADLRNAVGEVGTLEYGPGGAAPVWSVGRSVALADLALRGLAEGPSEARLSGRSLACPSCGNPIALALAGTKSVVCGQCRAVVDVSSLPADGAAVADGLAHYAQQTGTIEPLIPLGRTGRLATPDVRPGRPAAPVDWQVVGYVERCTLPDAGSDDEQFFWREYLLYHRSEGFAFLVDSDEGWTLVRPITGVPQGGGSAVKLDGVSYRLTERYASRTTYVLGEFYWVLRAGERTQHADYRGTGAQPRRRLNREETRSPGGDAEVTWSCGETLDAAAVRRAFGLAADAGGVTAGPGAAGKPSGFSLSPIVLFVALALVVVLLSRCSRSERCDDVKEAFGQDSAEYRECLQRGGAPARTGGGSFGGYSGGGGHK